MTTKRDLAKTGESKSTAPPGISNALDAVAALVPAEVLSLHAVILTFTTQTTLEESGNSVTRITETATLTWAFYALIGLSIVIYVLRRLPKFGGWDWVRVAIPPCAFVAWTMLQKTTAFDAIWPELNTAPRTVAALLIAVVLGLIAGGLAQAADQKDPGDS